MVLLQIMLLLVGELWLLKFSLEEEVICSLAQGKWPAAAVDHPATSLAQVLTEQVQVTLTNTKPASSWTWSTHRLPPPSYYSHPCRATSSHLPGSSSCVDVTCSSSCPSIYQRLWEAFRLAVHSAANRFHLLCFHLLCCVCRKHILLELIFQFDWNSIGAITEWDFQWSYKWMLKILGNIYKWCVKLISFDLFFFYV